MKSSLGRQPLRAFAACPDKQLGSLQRRATAQSSQFLSSLGPILLLSVAVESTHISVAAKQVFARELKDAV